MSTKYVPQRKNNAQENAFAASAVVYNEFKQNN